MSQPAGADAALAETSTCCSLKPPHAGNSSGTEEGAQWTTPFPLMSPALRHPGCVLHRALVVCHAGIRTCPRTRVRIAWTCCTPCAAC